MVRRIGLAHRINDLIGVVAPRAALRRDVALAKRSLLSGSMNSYRGAARGPRGADFRLNSHDAVEAARTDRARLSWISRDMLRNNPRVVKAATSIVNGVVGHGIVMSVRARDPQDEDTPVRVERILRAHLETTDIDADGRLNITGLQELIFRTIILSGEVLIRRRMRFSSDGYSLPFQIQVLEPDFLADTIDGPLPNGNMAIQGIEFDKIGRRVAYHLYEAHPGSRRANLRIKRIPAENIIHPFDIQRPGQVRGVSWFAPVITLLHDIDSYQDNQVKRQEIAALFAAVLKSETASDELKQELGRISTGAILTIGADEEMDFTDPPAVDGYEAFMRGTDRTIAAALGLTYEGFTGDYSKVNYTSGKMGRTDTDPNMLRWQNNIMLAQVCAPLNAWIKEAISDVADIARDTYDIIWTPPRRPLVDPTRDIPAFERARRAGFKSRRGIIREMGDDPGAVEAEIEREQKWADEAGLSFSSDASVPPRAPGK